MYDYYSIIKIVIILIVFFIIYFIQLHGHFKLDIKTNWKKYQCKPYIIPFAGFFKPENSKQNFFTFTLENFKKCQWSQIKRFFGFFIKPFQYIIKIINNIILDFTKTINIFRIEAKNIRDVFRKIVEMIAVKLENSYAAMQYYQAKMQNILKNQMAIFQLLMYFMDSLKLTMESLLNGPLIDLIKFFPLYGIALMVLIAICMLCLFGGPFTKMVACPICLVCFSPDTRCVLDNGRSIPIVDINLNDILQEGGIVKSQFIFYVGKRTCDMYDYEGIKVSGSHIVYEKYGINRVENSKKSKKSCYNGDYIYCLNTENNYICINNHNNIIKFSDFFENNNIYWNYINQKLIENTLNKSSLTNKYIKKDIVYHNYEWGIAGNTLIKMNDKTYKKIKDIEIDDCLYIGGLVYGLVKHIAKKSLMYTYKHNNYSGTQLVKYKGKWKRVYNIPTFKINFDFKEDIIYQLCCENHIIITKNFKLRDYLELKEDHPTFDLLLNNNIRSVRNREKKKI